MTPDRWKLINELYHATLDLDASARDEFLKKECAGDESLRGEVEVLLSAHEKAGDFIDTTALNDLAKAVALDSGGGFEGRQINQYRMLSRLGVGGMGEVYRAHDSKLDRYIAIKVLPAAGGIDTTASLRLVREARTASKLNHPNICTIHEVGEVDGQTFIAMELVEGEPLSARLKSGALPPADAIRYGMQLADALGHAHLRSIVHRDFKSANVMVNSEGRAKVLDFGLAKSLNREEVVEVTSVTNASITQPGLVVGTLPYMAPEQLRGHSADTRSDVWALGVVLYEMACGVRPFTGETSLDLSSAILAKDPPPLPSTVSAPLQTIIQRCLEKDPQQRYEDGSQVRTALEHIQEGRAPSAQHLPGSTRRVYIYAAALIALLIGGWVVRGLFNSPPAETFKRWPLTNAAGWDVAPSWSPDGKWIAYSDTSNGSADIAIIPAVLGSEPQILTGDSHADEFIPRFSPDGRKILFASDRGSGTNIYSIPIVGGIESLVAETHIPFLQRMGAWANVLGSNPWSPDGKKIVFSRLLPNGDVALFKKNLSTGDEEQLTTPAAGTEDGDAAWSFDGKQIAFDRGGSVYVIPANGGQPSVLIKDAFGAAWKPDDRGIVFSVGSAPPKLSEMDFATGRVTPLTTGAGPADIWAAVGPDGSIAYSEFSHEVNVYWTPLAGKAGEPEQLTSFSWESFGPRISLDGSKVLYYSSRTGNHEVWIFDRKSRMHRNLTNFPDASDRLADWSPTGKQIVFMSDRGGSVELWIANSETGTTLQLTHQNLPIASHTAEAEGGPRWAPDGKLVAYLAPAEGASAIWVVDPSGKVPPSVTSIRNAISFGWYKDSHRMLYIRQASDGSGLQQLVAKNISTGDEEVLLKRALAELSVAADGAALSFLDAVSHFSMDLWAHRLKPTTRSGHLPDLDGQPYQITFGKGEWHVHAGGWSRDASAVVYSRDKDKGDIWVMSRQIGGSSQR